MKNKPRDIPCCSVREDVIKKASPVLDEDVLNHHLQWVKDRYKIHINKDVNKLPAPWTDNIILQQVKFTNVRREHDRETRNLIENIANKHEHSMMDRMFNIILSRLWNKHQSWIYATSGQLLKFPMSSVVLNECLARTNSVKETDYTFYSSAYYTTAARHWMKKFYTEFGFKYEDIPWFQSPIYLAFKEFNTSYYNNIVYAKDQKECYEAISSLHGFGEFVSYQLFVDFTYMEDFPFSENEFTIAGPGCKKGLDLLFKDKDGMTYEECLFWMRDNIDYNAKNLLSDLPEDERIMNVMSLENTMCELQKYLKCVADVKAGKKPRGKNSYDGIGKSSTINMWSLK